jgi:hypothetical protein
MWLSRRAESFRHWAHRKAQPFSPITRIEYIEPVLYGFETSNGVIHPIVDPAAGEKVE